MQRREFLRRAGLLGGAAVLGGPTLLSACSSDDSDGGGNGGARRPAARPLLDIAATESPIDTVVVVMMENRSFDHYLGWMASDDAYLETGRSRYGGNFRVDGKQRQEFPGPGDEMVATASLLDAAGEASPYRGCGHPDPGHGWTHGRAQRDGGFLAPGSRNDEYALGYYDADALPFLANLARDFTVFDHWHCSVLTSTYPNRAYLHSAQSGDYKDNTLPFDTGGYLFENIWDRLLAAQVPVGYYYSDLPVLALWGQRMGPIEYPIDQYFAAAEAGTLPNVVFLDPAFLTEFRNDDHPHADIRAGQRFMQDVFRAFTESPQWERGAFVVTYDEWGGFFDHVEPPVLPDNRASADDLENFGQAGFRVPTVVASPYAERGFVDHHTYDHTSVLRFLEWRFLGAPPEGAGADGDTWFLTERDRNARNLGAALRGEDPEPEVGFDLTVAVEGDSEPCAEGHEGPPAQEAPTTTTAAPASAATPTAEKHSFEIAMDEGYFEYVGHRVEPSAKAKEWASA